MSARGGTSGVIWLAIVMIAVSIATSAMGLFMDSWRFVDEDEAEKEDEMTKGISGSQGLNNVDVEYDLTKFYGGLIEGQCDEFKDNMDDDDGGPTDSECLDDDTLQATFELSEMCDYAEEEYKDAKDYEWIADDDLDEYREDAEDTCDTADAGTTGSIILWIGFGGAMISMLLCVITAFSGDSGSRKAGGFSSLSAGLIMISASLIWVIMLPHGISGDSKDADFWVADLNFYLTIVGGFLAVVAGIIAFFAGRKGGRRFATPMHSMPQQQFQQQQHYQQPQQQQYNQQQHYQQPQQQQYNQQPQQQHYQQPQQQQQQYEQPKQYKQW